MYELLGLCLTLTTLLILNTLASLAAAIVWHGLKRYAQDWSATSRGRLLFTLRVFPPLVALACVALVILPSYLLYEPHESGEMVSLKLAALPLLSAAGILLAVWRGLMAWRATRRLTANWMRQAEPIKLHNMAIPSYRIKHPFPIIAIVGALRPRLFIADGVFQALSSEEFAAAIAHENGHLVAYDNLKRSLLRICRDVLTIVPCGRALDRAWTEASESAADEHAARASSETALDLASALVKIARLVPAGMRPAMPAGVSLIGDDISGIVHRVHRLTQLAGMIDQGEGRGVMAWRFASSASFGALLAAVTFLTTQTHFLATVHELIEQIVAALR